MNRKRSIDLLIYASVIMLMVIILGLVMIALPQFASVKAVYQGF